MPVRRGRHFLQIPGPTNGRSLRRLHANAERTLLPAVRDAGEDVLLVADGFSCQHQIHGATGRTALHVARVLDAASA